MMGENMAKLEPKGPNIYRGMTVGVMYFNARGKLTQDHIYKDMKQTPSGELEVSEWVEKTMAAVEADGLTDLFNQVYDIVKELKFLKTETERRERALCCLYIDAYLYWPEFTITWM